MKHLLSILFLLFINSIGFAQGISGKVQDSEGKALAGASITLIKSIDSSAVKYTATNLQGDFRLQAITDGDYLIKVTSVGFHAYISSIIEYNGTSLELTPISLEKTNESLSEVVVMAKKPMVEIKADKTILNVEGTINAVGTDALELLRKSPGVMVDKDENLSLSGKNGVKVYIDGRPTPLSGKDLAEYLKSMQSSNVEAIEIITNPSAKYDAAGNAGIINIRLKKNKSFGTNGSVNAGWAVGTFPKYNAGINLNNRNKHTNIFGSYNFNKNKSFNTINFYRTIADTLFDQKSTMINRGENHNFKLGTDFFINSKNTFGITLNGSVNEGSGNSKSSTPITYIPGNDKIRVLEANNSSISDRKNYNANLNYSYKDTSGRELNMDADYGYYDILSNQLQPNIYYDATGQTETSRIVYNMIAPSIINLYSFKTDYEQNYKKGKLGIGGKTSFVNTDNDFKRYDVYNTTSVLDTSRSNKFIYKENVNAIYVNYSRPFKGIIVQAGLRMENSNIEGTSSGEKYQNSSSSYLPYDSTFKRNYTDFFPSIAVTFNKNPMSQFGLSYSRRIDRPAYQDLNPFEFKLDEYSYKKGNTNLRPQYSNSFGLTHTYKYKLNTRLNYTHVQDIFAQLIDTAEISKSFISNQNLATQDIVSLNVSYPFSYKNYSVFANLNSNYSAYKADFGAGRKVNLNVFSYNIYMQHSLKFSKTWTAELSGFYASPSIWQGTFKSKAMGGVDVGVQKVIFNGKGNIKAALSDVFNSMEWGGSSNFAGQYFRANGTWESQQFKLNLSYRFGNNKVKAARQRKSALEEESKRTQGSGGLGQ